MPINANNIVIVNRVSNTTIDVLTNPDVVETKELTINQKIIPKSSQYIRDLTKSNLNKNNR